MRGVHVVATLIMCLALGNLNGNSVPIRCGRWSQQGIANVRGITARNLPGQTTFIRQVNEAGGESAQ